MKAKRARATETTEPIGSAGQAGAIGSVGSVEDEVGSELDLTVGPLIVDLADLHADGADGADGVVAGSWESELLRSPPIIREIVREVLAAIQEAVPGAFEHWIGAWKVFTIKTAPPKPRMFAYVSTLVDRVRIGIESGVEDPHGLFLAVKDRRYNQRDIKNLKDVRAKGFAELMQAAAVYVPPKKGKRGG